MHQLGLAQWLLQPLDRWILFSWQCKGLVIKKERIGRRKETNGEVVTDVTVTGSLIDKGRRWLIAQVLLDGFDRLLSIHHGHLFVCGLVITRMKEGVRSEKK